MSLHLASGPKGSTMTTTTITRRTELAHRTSDGIDVYLFWERANDPLGQGWVDCLFLALQRREALPQRGNGLRVPVLVTPVRVR
jgi:hypothetical protein